eukprot:TRINITY_DN63131_c0_g1_i1.p1 TRINITY_DN63131_c0_g1~~TRINITY_DN63131_c0_g1_i1.p1  ORF type:complete len:139 (+),score=17.89 TRINITY_DN63131_c0_g1_i1:140-556(+)
MECPGDPSFSGDETRDGDATTPPLTCERSWLDRGAGPDICPRLVCKCVSAAVLMETVRIAALTASNPAAASAAPWLLTSVRAHCSASNVGSEFGAQAVSYTHLRAHETPEHLVCRLLLEKKKYCLTKKNVYVHSSTHT